MKFNKRGIVGISLYSFGIAAMIALSTTAQIVCDTFGATFQAALGDFGKGHTEVNYEGVNPGYYKSDFDSKEEAAKFQKDTSYNIVKEGITQKILKYHYLVNHLLILFSEAQEVVSLVVI